MVSLSRFGERPALVADTQAIETGEGGNGDVAPGEKLQVAVIPVLRRGPERISRVVRFARQAREEAREAADGAIRNALLLRLAKFQEPLRKLKLSIATLLARSRWL